MHFSEGLANGAIGLTGNSVDSYSASGEQTYVVCLESTIVFYNFF